MRPEAINWHCSFVLAMLAIIVLYLTLKPIKKQPNLEFISSNIGIGSNMPQTNYDR